MENDFKEVYFHQYCKTCKYKDIPEAAIPCCECLNEPSNVNSHKPVRWEEQEK